MIKYDKMISVSHHNIGIRRFSCVSCILYTCVPPLCRDVSVFSANYISLVHNFMYL